VNGTNPGSVYVDYKADPTAALIWIPGQQGFQLIGNAQSSIFLTNLEEYIRNNIEPKLQKEGIHWVEIGVEKDTWDNTMQEIFINRNISSSIQHVYCLEDNLKAIELQDNEIIVRKIDTDLLNSKHLENHSFLEKKITAFWDSTDSFLQNGFGYFVERNNHLVSLCFSAFCAEQVHAIDIETLEMYRKSNYGKTVASAFIQECIQRGIQPYWDCTPENAGSNRIAKAIGLAPNFDYQIYWYKLI